MACPHCSGTRFCLCNGPVPVAHYAKDQDRAARIRARAERLLDIAWSLRSGLAEAALKGHAESVLGAFVLARFETDELNRLEAAELAEKTADVGQFGLGQDVDAWRTTCARRLPGLEDQGLVRAVVARPSLRRPHREVDPNLAPCTVSPGAPKSIRWWPR